MLISKSKRLYLYVCSNLSFIIRHRHVAILLCHETTKTTRSHIPDLWSRQHESFYTVIVHVLLCLPLVLVAPSITLSLLTGVLIDLHTHPQIISTSSPLLYLD